MPNPRPHFLLLAGLSVLAGCISSGDFVTNVPIAGGGTVALELGKSGMVPGENDDFKIEAALLTFDPATRKGTYKLGFEAKRGVAPLRVTVDDVTDDTPVTLFQTDKIQLQNGRWKGQGEDFTPDEQNSKWMFELETNIRVYRFTFAMPDGRSEIVYQGYNYPAFIKELVRITLALPPPKAAPAAAPAATH
jgi:hypothetical protein